MYWLRHKYNWIIAIALSITIGSCMPSEKEDREGPLSIVCTTAIIADGIKNIVNDSAKVDWLMGPGVDPHLYKATQGDLQKLQSADIVIYNGLHLEGKMGEILEKLASVKKVIAVADELDKASLINNTAFQDAYDPHIWFDIKKWSKGLASISRRLGNYAPELAEHFQQSYKEYAKQLDSLDRVTRERIAAIPEQRRVLITAHDAFSYFGQAYNIQVKGLQGISTLSESGLRDRIDLVDFIVEREISAVFIETSVPRKAIDAVVEGCQSKGHDVVIGGSLFSDAMGADGTPEGTYIGMVHANVSTIVEGLNRK